MAGCNDDHRNPGLSDDTALPRNKLEFSESTSAAGSRCLRFAGERGLCYVMGQLLALVAQDLNLGLGGRIGNSEPTDCTVDVAERHRRLGRPEGCTAGVAPQNPILAEAAAPDLSLLHVIPGVALGRARRHVQDQVAGRNRAADRICRDSRRPDLAPRPRRSCRGARRSRPQPAGAPKAEILTKSTRPLRDRPGQGIRAEVQGAGCPAYSTQAIDSEHLPACITPCRQLPRSGQ